MINCEHCAFSTNHISVYFKHFAELHISQHKIVCPQENCFRKFKSVHSLRRHLRSKHAIFARRNVLHANELHSPDTDSDASQVGVDDQEPHEDRNRLLCPVELKRIISVKLLSLREANKIPSTVTTDIANEIAALSDLSQQQFASETQELLRQRGIVIDDELKEFLCQRSQVSVACEALNSQAKLERFAEQNLTFIDPEEVFVDNLDSYQYVPITASIKRLLSFSDVLREVTRRHQASDDVLRDIADGRVFKANNRLNSPRSIGIILYFDEFTVTNPLRGLARKHKILACYMVLTNISSEHRFEDKCVQLVSLCKSIYAKKHGIDSVTSRLTQELTNLYNDGLTIRQDNTQHEFTCDLFCVLGDNLSQHQIGGFMESFTASLPCRFCSVNKESLRLGKLGQRRTPNQHNQQLDSINTNPQLAQAYGVKQPAVFANIGTWHCIGQMPSDIAHDVFEGVCKKLLGLVLSHCLRQNYFTLDNLNERLSAFEFVSSDKTDKPSKLLSLPGNRVAIKQSFAQVWCLTRLLPLIIGHLVPENDDSWSVFLKLLLCIEYICAQSIRPGQVHYLNDLINEFYEDCKRVFQNELTPKEHYMLHYADQILDFGPLRHLWTFRLEAKHQYFMNVVKLNRCHRNICKTLARRHQFMHSLENGKLLFSNEYTPSGVRLVFVNKLPLRYRGLVLQQCESRQVQSCKAVRVKNCTYATGLAVHVLNEQGDGLPCFHEIEECFVIKHEIYIAVCKLFTVDYEPHYNAYLVERTQEFALKAMRRYHAIATLGIYKLPMSNTRAVILKHRAAFPGDSR